MTLFVRVDDDGLLHPSVQLRGDLIPAKAVLAVTLVTADERVHRQENYALPPGPISPELSLPSFALPTEIQWLDVLTSRWDVEVRVRRRVVTRWSVYLSDYGGLNEEAEIDSVAL